MRIRYSRWDGTQKIDDLDADDLLAAMADDLTADGDIWNALRRLFQRGMHDPRGPQMPGLQDLLQQLRKRRQQQLDRYDLGHVDPRETDFDALGKGEAVDKPVYDYATHLRSPVPERVGPADVVIVDGILLFADVRVRDRCAMKVFIDTDADERLIRRGASGGCRCRCAPRTCAS